MEWLAESTNLLSEPLQQIQNFLVKTRDVEDGVRRREADRNDTRTSSSSKKASRSSLQRSWGVLLRKMWSSSACEKIAQWVSHATDHFRRNWRVKGDKMVISAVGQWWLPESTRNFVSFPFTHVYASLPSHSLASLVLDSFYPHTHPPPWYSPLFIPTLTSLVRTRPSLPTLDSLTHSRPVLSQHPSATSRAAHWLAPLVLAPFIPTLVSRLAHCPLTLASLVLAPFIPPPVSRFAHCPLPTHFGLLGSRPALSPHPSAASLAAYSLWPPSPAAAPPSSPWTATASPCSAGSWSRAHRPRTPCCSPRSTRRLRCRRRRWSGLPCAARARPWPGPSRSHAWPASSPRRAWACFLYRK